MKIKVAFESILAGGAAATFSFYLLESPVIRIALTIRREEPYAWFSGLITFYALLVVLAISLAAGGLACCIVYKHSAGKDRRR